MGTMFSFDLRTPGTDLAPVLGWLHEADARFSTYRPDSEVTRLARGELTLDACHPDVREVLDLGRAAERAGWGAFSLTARGRLDPSAVVKGWAIERAGAMLSGAGSAGHLINGGGDVLTHGSPTASAAWRVAIADPLCPRSIAAVVADRAGRALAVATSGSAERGTHVLDARAGRPPSGPVSITVVGTAGITAVDIAATTAFAFGDDGLEWLAARPGMAGFAVMADGTRRTTANWSAFAVA